VALVKVSYSSGGQRFQASIDGTGLDGVDGKAELEVADGVHYLYWMAWGPPDARVKVQITDPPEARFSYEDAIGPDFKNLWHNQFHVGKP